MCRAICKLLIIKVTIFRHCVTFSKLGKLFPLPIFCVGSVVRILSLFFPKLAHCFLLHSFAITRIRRRWDWLFPMLYSAFDTTLTFMEEMVCMLLAEFTKAVE